MDKDSRDKRFIRKPIFPGGNSAFKKFIKENLKYPKEALDNKTEGLVIVKYDINYKGEVVKTKVVAGIGSGCDEEAQRIVKLLKFEIPKGPRKLKITFHKTTRIRFKLPKKTNKTINYHYKKEGEKTSKPSSSNYNYTISW